jgi:hypothetical protein
MDGEHGGGPARSRDRSREWWISAGAIVLIVLLRSAFFVVWPLSQFDSDQAITGLMAKHLSELRAFPVFYYGQNYMLAVEAWLTAAVFLVAGVSANTLRLPLVAINVGIALMLMRLLVRGVGLRPAVAAVPVLFFALPAPGTAAHLLETNGGNVEPLAYILLLWMTRFSPRWCGFIFAIGFLQREFALYGLLALVLLEAFAGVLFTREGLGRRGIMLRTAAITWLTVQWLKSLSSAAGPGTSMVDIFQPHDNLAELAGRMCFDLRTIPSGVWRLITIHWPVLFGTVRAPVLHFGVDTTAVQGMPGGSILLAAVLLVPVWVILSRWVGERQWRPEHDFCAYLVLTALLSCAGYIVARCGEVGFVLMRYELLSVLGAVGLGAWCLAIARGWTQRVWIALACATVSISAVPHASMVAQYMSHPPISAKLTIARQLEARGIRYATANYWIAYAVTFLTNESTIIASTDLVRIREYNRIIEAHPEETVHIRREPCSNGHQVMTGIYFCSP